ncbi:MAG TPA: ISL3 family transposase [Halothiobacillaceae bacterium]|nr:ISL3 family transposase [Halothiobacillaceae bacterium]
MPDFLHLQGLRTLHAEDLGDHYRVEAVGCVVPTSCPACFNALYRHGTQRQTYMDTPMHGKRVLIEIERKRYRCKVCGKTLFEPLPSMDGKRQATSRLIEYIEARCLRKTFADLSREIGVDDKTIRHVFDDYIRRLKETVVFETPEIMGIDELKIIGQYRAMITNIEKLALFDMLPTRNKTDLLAYFSTMPDKQRVRVLNMDMWSVYRQVAQDQFPGRMVVADRFHVVRTANNALEAVRKAIRKGLDQKTRIKLKDDRDILLARRKDLDERALEKLDRWKEMFPVLGAAYEVKEAFHDIYLHRSKDDAMKAAQEWRESVPSELDVYFRDLKGLLGSWWAEIFNYYDCPTTNAYTESVNNLADERNRMGRGYSFEVIRAKLVYDNDARKDTRTTIRKKVRKPIPTVGLVTANYISSPVYETVLEEKTVEYGAYIPTLVRKLRNGEFE